MANASKKIEQATPDLPQVETTRKETFFQRKIFFQIVLGGLIIAFSILTFLVKSIDYSTNSHAYFKIDLAITKFIQQINFPLFNLMMNFLTRLGNTEPFVLTVAVAAIAASLYKKYREAVLILISSFGASLIAAIFKTLVQRPRPDPSLILQVGHFAKSDSFPSGHVLSFMGFYGILIFLTFTLIKQGFLRKGLLFIFIFILAFIGPSRIYLGAHWFSDTLGSYLIGGVWLFLMVFLYRRYKYI